MVQYTDMHTTQFMDRVRRFVQPALDKLTQIHTNVVTRFPKVAEYEELLSEKAKVVFNSATMFARRKRRARSRLQRHSQLSPEQKKLLYYKWLRFGAFGALIGVVLMMVLFFVAVAWFSKELPKPGEVVRRQGFSTKIYDRNGELLYDLFDDERRNPVSNDEIPEHLKQAVVAIEDKDFYKHSGFDFLTIVRIPYNVIFKQRVVGGSTLTQQLVKNALLTNERSVSRKFKELVLSLQLERKFTKDEILTMYLNEAPYGGTAWGVGTAAEVYFNKDVSELNLVESAILAGLPQRPSAYSPYIGKTDEDGEPLWKVRTRGVLIRMKEDKYITDLAYEEAVASLDSVTFEQSAIDIRAPHFVFYVQSQLEEMLGEEVVNSGGFTVTTTLDWEVQEKAQQVVQEEVSDVEELNITNGAALVMQPDTGEILSMVGSRDYNNDAIGGQFNVVVDGLRQPGSSIKPVTYLTLFQHGYSPSSILVDVPTTFQQNKNIDPYEPKNYDGKFRGPVSVRNSLGSSLNIPAVKALAIVGVDSFLQQAFDMGLVTLEPTQENMQRFGLAATLGGADVHMIDLVSAYSSFANGGTRVEPVSILKVEDPEGKVVYEHRQVEGPEVMTEQEAFLINNILSDNTARLMAFGANSLLNVNSGVAVKTGTTNDQRDNWAIGWSKDVIVGTWVGNNDNSKMKAVASGVSGASPIWRRIIVDVLDREGYDAPVWEMPEGVEKIAVDQISGYPSHDDFPAKEDYFIKGTVPTTPDPIHTFIELCKGERKLANDARIRRGDYDKEEFIVLKEEDPFSEDGVNRWQEAINAWVTGQDDSRYKVPTEYCGDENEVYLNLQDPDDKKNYDEEKVPLKFESESSDGIEKVEIYVNGELRETINDRRYEGTLNLSAGRYEIQAKAYSKSGKTTESGKHKIGTGGVDWEKPEPSPTPTPTPSPTPSPSPLISPLPTPDP